MPNWCSNGITLRHADPQMIQRAAKALAEGSAEDMIAEAIAEARKEALRLVGSLQRVVDTAAA